MKVENNDAVNATVQRQERNEAAASAGMSGSLRSGGAGDSERKNLSAMGVGELNKLGAGDLRKLNASQLNKLNASQLNKLDVGQLKKLNAANQAKLNQAQRQKLGLPSQGTDSVALSAEALNRSRSQTEEDAEASGKKKLS